MNEFTSSRGITITPGVNGTGGMRIQYANSADEDSIYIPGFASQAIREYVRAEEDERLGRWRWPENHAVVVYPEIDGLHWVVREDTGEAQRKNGIYVHDAFGTAASDYRDAHPEPKPWHDAKDGEIWAVTVDGIGEFAAQVDVYSDFPQFICLDNGISYGPRDGITSGRRIWPEVHGVDGD